MATFTIPEGTLNASGELQMSRAGSSVASKCPFRKTDPSSVSNLLTCDHNCPHFTESFDADGETSHVRLTCGGGGPPVWRITQDLRSTATGETISTLLSPFSTSVQWGSGVNETKFAGFKFTTAQAADLSKVTWFVSSVAVTSGTLICQIFSDSGGKPNSQVGGNSATVTLTKHTHGEQNFTWSSSIPGLSANTTYWALLSDTTSGTGGVFALGATFNNPLSLTDGSMNSGTGTGSSYSAGAFTTKDSYEFMTSVVTSYSSAKTISTLDEPAQSLQTWGNAVAGAQSLGWGIRTTSTANGSVSRVRLKVAYVSETMQVVAKLYSDSTGKPGTQTGGDSNAIRLTSTSSNQTLTFTWSASVPSLSATTKYWVVLTDTSSTGHCQVQVTSDNPLGLAAGYMNSGKHDTVGSIADQSAYEFMAEIKFA